MMTHQRDWSRRSVLRTTAVAGGVGALAGCLSTSEETNDDGDETGNGDDGDGGGGDDGSDGTDVPYTVEMEPVGEVEFEAVPEDWFAYTGDYADMGVALGQADGLQAIGIAARYGAHYYDELPDVSVDKGELTELWTGDTDPEVFYELEADVHLIDPNFMVNRIGWDEDDIEEIDRTVAPFVGNSIFSSGYEWHDYEYYSLYEAFEKVAEVFQERERYEAFADLHEEVVADVESRLPDDRPDVAVVYAENEAVDSFLPYVIGEGTQSKHWRELDVGRALANSDVADFHQTRGSVDFETLAQVDPDVLAFRFFSPVSESEFQSEFVAKVEDHPVGGDLTAVQNDRVVRGGMAYQGPIIHLFQLEQAARDVYPDEFGGEELFDRDRVNDVVTGEFE